MKKIIILLLVAAVLAGCFSLITSAEDAIIKDGLVAYYDGANNSNGKQDQNATL